MLHNSSKHFLFLCQWMCFVPSVWQQLCKNAREQLFCWKDVTHYRIRKYIDLTGVAHTIFAKRGARLVEHTIHFAMNETCLERKETSSRKVWQAKTTCGKWVAIAFFDHDREAKKERNREISRSLSPAAIKLYKILRHVSTYLLLSIFNWRGT